MKKTQQIFGFLKKINGSFSQGTVTLTFSSDNLGETISFLFNQECQITLSIGAILSTVNNLKKQWLSGVPSTDGYWEEESLTTGLFMSGKGLPIPKAGEVHINFRSNGDTQMLSIAYEDKGEISVPYLPVKRLIKDVREAKL